MDITSKIIEYIYEQKLDIDKICHDTKISRSKFVISGDNQWTAAELIVICSYLDIQPENFYEKKHINIEGKTNEE